MLQNHEIMALAFGLVFKYIYIYINLHRFVVFFLAKDTGLKHIRNEAAKVKSVHIDYFLTKCTDSNVIVI